MEEGFRQNKSPIGEKEVQMHCTITDVLKTLEVNHEGSPVGFLVFSDIQKGSVVYKPNATLTRFIHDQCVRGFRGRGVEDISTMSCNTTLWNVILNVFCEIHSLQGEQQKPDPYEDSFEASLSLIKREPLNCDFLNVYFNSRRKGTLQPCDAEGTLYMADVGLARYVATTFSVTSDELGYKYEDFLSLRCTSDMFDAFWHGIFRYNKTTLLPFKDRIYQVRSKRKGLSDELVRSIRPVSYTHLTLPTNREV